VQAGIGRRAGLCAVFGRGQTPALAGERWARWREATAGRQRSL